MSQPIQLIAIVASLALVALVLDLIRRQRIKEELWFAWLIASLGPLVCSLWLGPWTALAHALGMHYEPALLLTGGVFFSLLLLLYFTTVLSSLMRQNQRLAQEVAYLGWRLEQLGRADGAG